MKFGVANRRTVRGVYARDVRAGDVLCECLNRYCKTRTTEFVYREEGRVLAVQPNREHGSVQIAWRTPYGETRVETIPSYTTVMVVR